MAVDDPGENISKIAERLDTAEFAGFDQRRDDGPVLGATVGACKEGVLVVEGDGSDGALDHVTVDLDTAVFEEVREPFPASERVADRLGGLCLLADQAELLAQPTFEVCNDRRLFS